LQVIHFGLHPSSYERVAKIALLRVDAGDTIHPAPIGNASFEEIMAAEARRHRIDGPLQTFFDCSGERMAHRKARLRAIITLHNRIACFITPPKGAPLVLRYFLGMRRACR
jgi:hypothetical protein